MPRLVSSPIGGARLLCFGATPCAGSRRRHCARPRGTLKSSRYRGKGGGSREEGHERCKSERCVCSESGRRSVTLKSFAGQLFSLLLLSLLVMIPSACDAPMCGLLVRLRICTCPQGNPQAFITECADQCLQDQGEESRKQHTTVITPVSHQECPHRHRATEFIGKTSLRRLELLSGEGIQAGEWPEELSPESESETSRRSCLTTGG